MKQENPDEEATYLWVAETVLRRHKRPLKAGEIARIGIEDGLFGDKNLSKTPQKSMQARLSTHILRFGKSSQFMRVGRGRFVLRQEPLLGDVPGDAKQTLQEYVAPRRKPPPSTERVLVIAKRDYATILDFQGLNLSVREIVSQLLASGSLDYMSRSQAEVSDHHKQFITYTLIQRRNSVLSFRRGQYNRSANFLRGARCVGFGGHVNEEDLDIFSYEDRGIRANAAREIGEELRFKSGRIGVDANSIEPVGILNDDSSEVGKRHLAVVLRYNPPDNQEEWDTPIRGEASVNQIRWTSLTSGRIDLPQYEYWSQICLRKLFPSSVSGSPSYSVRRRSSFTGDHALCIIGSVGSGKSVATKVFRQAGDYAEINTGKVLAKLLGVPPVPATDRRKFQQDAADFISQPDGPDKLALAISNEVTRTGARRVIVDGLRHAATLEALRRMSPLPLAIVYIQTPPDIAFDLYRARDTDHHDLTAAEFMEILNAPVESEIRYMISEAHAIIHNWHGLDSYKRVLQAFIEETRLASGPNA